MTPDAKVRFYKAMYRAKCEQFDALVKEVNVLLEPEEPSLSAQIARRLANEPVYTDGTPTPPTCACGEIPTHVMSQTGQYVLNGTVHRLGEPCYKAGAA